ncbi:455_t:CDS:2 [Ambispora leptoticha]|uniref:455_t:CDS:1 n=1 Tax=Ambispora leptoticha TaxID=144679 RepID=A0A9N8WEB2_9GLOM|nr:455_t:CDS:2 [Ambispora leptoticha]
MPYKIGLVGLPNVGIMMLTDSRLEKLSKYYQSQKTTPSVVEIIDIAGLVKGAAQGAGLGNEFLSHIREVDLICHVLRCFTEKEIIHVEKTVDPIRDYETIQLELILADLQQLKKRLEKLKIKDENSQKEKALLHLIQENLEKEIPVSQINLKEEEIKVIKTYNFLTSKPFFLLVNFSGDQTEIKNLKKYAKEKKLSFLPLAIKLEKETENLSAGEKKELG